MKASMDLLKLDGFFRPPETPFSLPSWSCSRQGEERVGRRRLKGLAAIGTNRFKYRHFAEAKSSMASGFLAVPRAGFQNYCCVHLCGSTMALHCAHSPTT